MTTTDKGKAVNLTHEALRMCLEEIAELRAALGAVPARTEAQESPRLGLVKGGDDA